MIIFFFLNIRLNKLILSALQNHSPTWDHSHWRMRMQTRYVRNYFQTHLIFVNFEKKLKRKK